MKTLEALKAERKALCENPFIELTAIAELKAICEQIDVFCELRKDEVKEIERREGFGDRHIEKDQFPDTKELRRMIGDEDWCYGPDPSDSERNSEA